MKVDVSKDSSFHFSFGCYFIGNRCIKDRIRIYIALIIHLVKNSYDRNDYYIDSAI